MSPMQSVKRDILIYAPIETIWQTLTQPEHLNRWYTKDASVDFRVGGQMKLAHGWGVHTHATITEITNLERFVTQSEDLSLTITTLQQEGEGVRVTMEYRMELPFGEEGQAISENMGYGTLRFLQNFKSVYETGADQRTAMWRTWIGIFHTSGSQHGEQGIKVISVNPCSPAQQAGLLPGDFITQLNGQPTRNYDDFETMLNECMLQDVITLDVWRHGRSFQFQCVVAPYPRAYSA